MIPSTIIVCVLAAVLTSVPLTAQFSIDDLKEQASEMAKEAASDYNVPPEVISGLTSLAKSFDLSQIRLGGLAQDALQALDKGEDLNALEYLDELGDAASLSAGQRSLFQNAKVLVDTYVLQRNFGDLPQTTGPLGAAVDAIKSGDYNQAANQIRLMISEAGPTDAQREILNELYQQYEDWSRPGTP